MLRIRFLLLILGTYGCTDVELNTEQGGLSVEIDRSFEESVSQTYIKISSSDGFIYCISSNEIDRLYFEMSDPEDGTNRGHFDKDINYMRGIDITEPVYFVDDTGMKIFVDNFDKVQSFSLSYFKCSDLLDKNLDESSIEKTLSIK